MTDATSSGASPMMSKPKRKSILEIDAATKKRNAAEKRFEYMGLAAVLTGLFFLIALLVTIIGNGIPAFTQTFITLEVELQEKRLDKSGERDLEKIKKVTTFGYNPIIQDAIKAKLAEAGIETEITKGKDLRKLLSTGAVGSLRTTVLEDPSKIGETIEMRFVAASRVDGYMKGRVSRESLARDKNLFPAHLDIVDALVEEGSIERTFNWNFIFGSDASDSRPEQAGIGVAMLGSFFMMLVVLGLSLPVGVAASIYLEEFAPKNRFTDFIEVNISNLAAIPSIVFGILGLAVFIQFGGGVLGIPGFKASAPLVGGLVLTLMTLPTIIISTRASLKAVPPSIRDAALGVGASKMQSVFHHVLPLAMPGILTGTIIGLAQALGETAPLLLIGMVGFIASNYPDGLAAGFTDPNSAMPAQIFEWAKRADPAFYERAWGGIIILLVFLMTMNIIAIILRRRFERRW
ncbi:MAG: phosphate ABC transporter permease PstA [Pseudomonadota bacterium]